MQDNSIIKAKYQSTRVSPTIVMAELQRELQSQGVKVHKFGFGQSPFPIPSFLVEELKKNAHQSSYLHVQGHPPLREAIAKWYSKYTKYEIDASQVVCGPGTCELLYSFQNIFDGNCIVPNPFWVSYVPQSKLANNNNYQFNCFKDGVVKFDFEKLEEILAKLVGEGQKNNYLMINYPSNPTGNTFNRDELMKIADICRKYGTYVVSDEIYNEFTFEGEHSSIAEFYPEKTIISNGCSKWLSAGGWRLGCFIFPKEMKNFVGSMNMLQSDTFTSVSAPIQMAAVAGFTESVELRKYINNAKHILGVVAKLVKKRMEDGGINVSAGGGAFYFLMSFDHMAKAQQLRDAFAALRAEEQTTLGDYVFKQIIKETQVAIMHGSGFGRPDDELSFRMAYTDFNGGEIMELADSQEITEQTIIDKCPFFLEGLQKFIEFWNKLD